MTINEVIKSGQNIKEIELTGYSQFTVTSAIIFAVMVILAIIFIYGGIKRDSEIRKAIAFYLVLACALNYFFHVSIASIKEENFKEESILKWKIDVAKPFIESLPKVKKEIVYIKIDPELSESTYGTSVFGSGYTYSTTIEKTPLVVSYKDNGIVTRTNWFEASMNLTANEKPYIEYQILERDLGYGVKAGTYNTQIFLPETYTFTDIK